MSGRTAEHPLVQDALKKSTIVWLSWRAQDSERSMPVWYMPDGPRLYVLSGEREQRLEGAEAMTECTVTVRAKNKNIRLAELPARVRVVPAGAEWDELALKLAEKRLNAPGPPADTARGWRESCVILELTLR